MTHRLVACGARWCTAATLVTARALMAMAAPPALGARPSARAGAPRACLGGASAKGAALLPPPATYVPADSLPEPVWSMPYGGRLTIPYAAGAQPSSGMHYPPSPAHVAPLAVLPDGDAYAVLPGSAGGDATLACRRPATCSGAQPACRLAAASPTARWWPWSARTRPPS